MHWPTKALVERLTLTKLSGMDGYRSIWQAKLETAWLQLDAAILAHDAARTAYDDAFKAEMALRDAHLEMVDRVMGIVRAAFPRDRRMQDVIFPIMAAETPKRTATPDDENDGAPVSIATA